MVRAMAAGLDGLPLLQLQYLPQLSPQNQNYLSGTQIDIISDALSLSNLFD